MKIGLLGGTFDPVHIGHLVLAQEAWYRLGLDKVIFIPACINPLKAGGQYTEPADRLNMVRLALEGDSRFEISTFEIDAEGPSYTIDTVKYFKEKYKGDELFFLAGADSSEALSMWKEIDQILELVTFCIATRPGWCEKSPYDTKVKRINIPLIEVSSTLIRERIRSQEAIDYLVPKKVVKYIRDKGLYRDQLS